MTVPAKPKSLILKVPRQAVQARPAPVNPPPTASPTSGNTKLVLSDDTTAGADIDVDQAYKHAVETPGKTFVMRASWQQQVNGRTVTRCMYSLNLKFVVAMFGLHVHCGGANLALQVVSVKKDGKEHKQALANCGAMAPPSCQTQPSCRSGSQVKITFAFVF